MKVFISYTRRDPDKRSYVFAKKLATFLASHRVDVTFDEISFKHSKRIADEMINGIYNSDKLIFLVSPSALKSKYVMAELGYARDKSIKMQPKSFFHVVLVTDEMSFSDLPPDLSSYLCHSTVGKSDLKLLYEIFLSIHGIVFGNLMTKMINHNPDAPWIMPELYRKITIVNKNGDIKVSTLRTMLNVGPNEEKETRRMHIWSDNDPLPKGFKVSAFDLSNQKLKVNHERLDYRGHDCIAYNIRFKKSVRPEDVVSFWTSYSLKNVFDLFNGDQYPLSCADMIYGYLRLDLVFPRNIKMKIPTVDIIGSKKYKPKKLESIGHNYFSYSKLETSLGTDYIFNIKCLTNKVRLCEERTTI